MKRKYTWLIQVGFFILKYFISIPINICFVGILCKDCCSINRMEKKAGSDISDFCPAGIWIWKWPFILEVIRWTFFLLVIQVLNFYDADGKWSHHFEKYTFDILGVTDLKVHISSGIDLYTSVVAVNAVFLASMYSLTQYLTLHYTEFLPKQAYHLGFIKYLNLLLFLLPLFHRLSAQNAYGCSLSITSEIESETRMARSSQPRAKQATNFFFATWTRKSKKRKKVFLTFFLSSSSTASASSWLFS